MQLLSGIKVIDFSKWLPGQYCGMLLGDYGAEVVKVESLDGDGTRKFFPEKEPGMSYWHLMLNRNKRGVAVNIKTPAGQEIMKKMLQDADVFLEGFRPGYLARYGLDYETIHQLNPNLVYCSITGFGQKSHKPAHDLNILGLAGISSLDDLGRACAPSVQVSALSGSLNALSSICMALLARERGAQGQHLDVSLMATAMSLQVTNASSIWGCQETGCQPFGRIAPYYNVYETKDQRFLTVGTMEPKFWKKLCELLHCPELLEQQFAFGKRKEIQTKIAALIAEKTQAEWLELIGDEEFCVTPVCSLAEALESDLVTQQELIKTESCDLGALRYVTSPVKFSEAESSIRRRAPRLGEHTETILRELGYNEVDMAKFREAGAI